MGQRGEGFQEKITCGGSSVEDHGFRVVAGVQELQNEKIGIVPRALIF